MPIHGLSALADEGVLVGALVAVPVGALVGADSGVGVDMGTGVVQADKIKTKAIAMLNGQIFFIYILIEIPLLGSHTGLVCIRLILFYNENTSP